MSDEKYVQKLIDTFGKENVTVIDEKAPEIKSCPFCGNDCYEIEIEDDWIFRVKCSNCGAMGPSAMNENFADSFRNYHIRNLFAEIDAVTRWNEAPRKDDCYE